MFNLGLSPYWKVGLTIWLAGSILWLAFWWYMKPISWNWHVRCPACALKNPPAPSGSHWYNSDQIYGSYCCPDSQKSCQEFGTEHEQKTGHKVIVEEVEDNRW